MEELKPCPFCGGEAELHPTYDMDTNEVDGYFVWCDNKECECRPETREYFTEAEAIAAWNTRAAYEMDGWFYLPKPKQQLFGYTTGFSFDDLSLKSTGTVDVYAITSAVQKWQEEALNAQIIERICEVFKPEKTCHRVDVNGYSFRFECSACGYVAIVHNCETRLDELPNYCPSCGRKVVGE